MSAPEQPPRVERPSSPEKSIQRHITPPRARMLAACGENNPRALHPDYQGNPTKESLVKGLAENPLHLEPFAGLTAESRTKHYEGDSRDFDTQRRDWTAKTQKWINWAVDKRPGFSEALRALDITETERAAEFFYEDFLDNVYGNQQETLTRQQSEKNICVGLDNFSQTLSKACTTENGDVDINKLGDMLESLGPLLNSFGTVLESNQRVADYVVARALLDHKDLGEVADGVLEGLGQPMSRETEESMNALAGYANVRMYPSPLEPRNESTEPVPTVVGAAPLTGMKDESISDHETSTQPMPEEEDKSVFEAVELLLKDTPPFTEVELQNILVLEGKELSPEQITEELRQINSTDKVTLNVLKELAKFGEEDTREIIGEDADEAEEMMREKLYQLGLPVEDYNIRESYLYQMAEEKFFAERPDVKKLVTGDDFVPSIDPTAFLLDNSLSEGDDAFEASRDASMHILYKDLGEIIVNLSDEERRELLSRLSDTLSEEHKDGLSKHLLFLEEDEKTPERLRELGEIIWNALPEINGEEEGGEEDGGVQQQPAEQASEGTEKRETLGDEVAATVEAGDGSHDTREGEIAGETTDDGQGESGSEGEKNGDVTVETTDAEGGPKGEVAAEVSTKDETEVADEDGDTRVPEERSGETGDQERTDDVVDATTQLTDEPEERTTDREQNAEEEPQEQGPTGGTATADADEIADTVEEEQRVASDVTPEQEISEDGDNQPPTSPPPGARPQ